MITVLKLTVAERPSERALLKGVRQWTTTFEIIIFQTGLFKFTFVQRGTVNTLFEILQFFEPCSSPALNGAMDTYTNSTFHVLEGKFKNGFCTLFGENSSFYRRFQCWFWILQRIICYIWVVETQEMKLLPSNLHEIEVIKSVMHLKF